MNSLDPTSVSTKNDSLPSNQPSKQAKKEKKSAKNSLIKQFIQGELPFKLSACITQLRCRLHFTPEQGLYITSEKLEVTFPDSRDQPLVVLEMLSVSQIQQTRVINCMGNINYLQVFSPQTYKDFPQKLGSDMSNQLDKRTSPSETSQRTDSCKEGDDCHRFVGCARCREGLTDSHQCNGYDNQCSQHDNILPDDVFPFWVVVGDIDLLQDTRYPWGNLIDAASKQWKAFKMLWKKPRPTPPYPHPDKEREQCVEKHEAISATAMKDAYWVHLTVSSLILRMQDCIIDYYPSYREYSFVLAENVNIVAAYHPLLHSRGHLLRFMKQVDDAETPFHHGFTDVIGMHIHNGLIQNIKIGFHGLPSLVDGNNVSISGTFAVANIRPVTAYSVKEEMKLYCSTSFDPYTVTITRNSIPMKFYQNFHIQGNQLYINWGNPLNLVQKSFSSCMGVLTPKGSGRAPKLPWFDKLRSSIHGPCSLRVVDELRFDWLTDTSIDNRYEAVTVKAENAYVLFRKMGGVDGMFDVLTVGVSKFDKSNNLIFYPVVEISDGVLDIGIKWGNSQSKNHYVELLLDLWKQDDKWYYYRTHTIEYSVELKPAVNKAFSTAFFLRAELIEFFLNFMKSMKDRKSLKPKENLPTLVQNATNIDLNMMLENCEIWV